MIRIPAPQKPAPGPQQAPAQGKPPEEKLEAPVVEGIKIPGKRIKQAADLESALSTLSFLRTATERESVAVLNVESRDIKRNPYLFSIIYLKPDFVEMVYSIVPGTSARKRKIEVLRHLLNILSVISGAYELDYKYLYQNLQSALKDLTEFASSDYNDIFAKYDSLQRDATEARRKLELIESSNAKISKDLIEARSENDELTLRVKQLEAYSNEALMVKIQDWLDLHRNEISVTEFAKQYGVLESRVESILNEMVIRGYLELRG